MRADSDGGTPTWRFERDGDALVIRRIDDTRLMMSGTATLEQRTVTFPNVAELHKFLSNFEAHLVSSGWSLASFATGLPAARAPLGGRGLLPLRVVRRALARVFHFR